MPITRTPIIDDDGSGQTGTVLDNAWKQELYGQIDALGGQAISTLAIGSPITVPVAGIMANLDPPGSAAKIVWFLTPTAAGTNLTGIKAPAVEGTQHLLINASGYPIIFSNAHATSSPVNQFIGPGYADYSLGAWNAAWIYYPNIGGSWIVLKP